MNSSLSSDTAQPRPGVVESDSTTTDSSQLLGDGDTLHDCITECSRVCHALKGALRKSLPSTTAAEDQSDFKTRSTRSTVGLVLDDNIVDEVIIGGPAYVSNQLDGGDIIVEVNGKPAGKETLEYLLVGEDVPGTTVTLGFLKGGKTGPKGTVELTRMGSDVVADRCRMLELLAKMKARSSNMKGGGLLVQYVDRVVEMFADAMVRDGEREKQTSQSLAELQKQCGAALASLSRNLALIGTKVDQLTPGDPDLEPTKHPGRSQNPLAQAAQRAEQQWRNAHTANESEDAHVQNAQTAVTDRLLVVKLNSAASDVLQLLSDLQSVREDCQAVEQEMRDLDAYVQEFEQEIHTQRTMNEILVNAFRRSSVDSDDDVRRFSINSPVTAGSEHVSARLFSVHSPEGSTSPLVGPRRISGMAAQTSLLSPTQEAHALAQSFLTDRGRSFSPERCPEIQERALRQQNEELERDLERALESLRHCGQMGIAKQEELGTATKELILLRKELADAGETVQRVQRANEELEHEVSVLRVEAEQGREFVERLETMEESMSDFQGKLGQDVVCNSLKALWDELVCALNCVDKLQSFAARDTTDENGLTAIGSGGGSMFTTTDTTPKEGETRCESMVEIQGLHHEVKERYRASVDFCSLRVSAGSENGIFLSQVLHQALEKHSSESQSLVSSRIAAEALTSSVVMLQNKIRDLEQQSSESMWEGGVSSRRLKQAEEEVLALRGELARLTKTIDSVNARSEWVLSSTETRSQRLKEQESELEMSRQAQNNSVDASLELERHLNETLLHLATAQNERICSDAKAEKLAMLLETAKSAIEIMSRDLKTCEEEKERHRIAAAEMENKCRNAEEVLAAHETLQHYREAQNRTVGAAHAETFAETREDAVLQSAELTTRELELEQLQRLAEVTLSSLRLEFHSCYQELSEIVLDSEKEEHLLRSRNSEVTAHVSALEEDNGKHRCEVQDLRAQVLAFDEENCRLTAQVSELEEEKGKVEQHVSALEQGSLKLQEIVREMSTSTLLVTANQLAGTEKMEVDKAKVAELERKAEAARMETERLQEELEREKKKSGEREEELRIAVAEAERKGEEAAELGRRMGELEGEMARAEDEAGRLGEEVRAKEEALGKVEALKEKVAKLEADKVEGLGKEVSELEGKLSEREARIRDLESEMEQQKGELVSSSGVSQQLEAQLQRESPELERLDLQAGAIQSAFEQAVVAVDALRGRVCVREVAEAEGAKVAELERETARLQEELEGERKKSGEREEELRNAVAEAERKGEEAAELGRRMGELEGEKARAEEEAGRLGEEVRAKEEALRRAEGALEGAEEKGVADAGRFDEGQALEKFKHYDQDGSGKLDTPVVVVLAADLFRSLNPAGSFSAAQLKEMRENLLQQMDEKEGDGGGKVSFEEFLVWYKDAVERHSQMPHGAAQDQSKGAAAGSSAPGQSRDSKSDSPILIESVQPGSVADECGAEEGDEVVEVGGKKVEGLSVEEVEGLLAGAAGTGVRVKGKRGENTYTADLVRRREVGEVSGLEEAGREACSRAGELHGAVDALRKELAEVQERGAEERRKLEQELGGAKESLRCAEEKQREILKEALQGVETAEKAVKQQQELARELEAAQVKHKVLEGELTGIREEVDWRDAVVQKEADMRDEEAKTADAEQKKEAEVENKKMAELEREAEAARMETERLQEELERERKRSGEREEELLNAVAEAERKGEEAAELGRRMGGLEGEMARAEEAAGRLGEEVRAKEEALGKVEALKEKVAKLEADKVESMLGLGKEVSELEGKLSEREARIRDLESEMEQQKGELVSSSGVSQQLEAQLQRESPELERLGLQAGAIQSAFEQAVVAVDALRGRVCVREVAEAEGAKVAELERETARLQEELEGERKKSGEREEELRIAVAEAERKGEEAAELGRRMGELEGEMARAKEEAGRLGEEVRAKEEALGKVEALKEKVAKLEADKVESMLGLGKEVSELEGKLSEREARIRDLESEMEQQKGELVSSSGVSQQLEAQLQRESPELERLDLQAGAIQSAFEQAVVAVDALRGETEASKRAISDVMLSVASMHDVVCTPGDLAEPSGLPNASKQTCIDQASRLCSQVCLSFVSARQRISSLEEQLTVTVGECESSRLRLDKLEDELRDQNAARSDASSRLQAGLDREAQLSTQLESSNRDTVKEKARADALEASVQSLAEELRSCESRIDAADSKCLDAIARERDCQLQLGRARTELGDWTVRHRRIEEALTRKLGEAYQSVKELHAAACGLGVEDFWGVGMHLHGKVTDAGCVVAAHTPSLSSLNADTLEDGDIIHSINGNEVVSVSTLEAARLLVGAYGSKVQLDGKRTGRDELFSLELERNTPDVESILEMPGLVNEARVAIREAHYDATKLRIADEQRESLLTQKVSLEEKNSRMKTDAEALQTRLEEQVQRCLAADKEIVALTAQNRELSDECEQLKTVVEMCQRERSTDREAMTRLKDEKVELERRGIEFKLQVDATTSEMESMKSNFAEHSKRLLDMAAEKRNLEHKHQQLEDKTEALQRNLETHVQEKGELKRELDHSRHEQGELHKVCERIKSENASLADAAAREKAAQQKAAELSETLQNLHLKSSMLARELVDVKEQNAMLRNTSVGSDELAKLEEKRQLLEMENKQLREELITIVTYTDSKRAEQHTSMAAIDIQVEEAAAAVTHLESILSDMHQRKQAAPRTLQSIPQKGAGPVTATREQATNTESVPIPRSSLHGGTSARGLSQSVPSSPSPSHWLGAEQHWQSFPDVPHSPAPTARSGFSNSTRSPGTPKSPPWRSGRDLGDKPWGTRINFQF